MRRWIKDYMMAAVLLAGAAAFYYFALVLPGKLRSIESPLAQQRSAIEECRRAARMVFDVQWAAACMTDSAQSQAGDLDGHADCDLPDAKAAVVNAWLTQDENRCLGEVRAGLDR